MKTRFPTEAVTDEATRLTKLGGHYAFSKIKCGTQEASRIRVTGWNQTFVSTHICINFPNFPQNNNCPFILGWIAFEFNKAKTFVAPSVRSINALW
jgi:hypothetical protein